MRRHIVCAHFCYSKLVTQILFLQSFLTHVSKFYYSVFLLSVYFLIDDFKQKEF